MSILSSTRNKFSTDHYVLNQ